MRDMRLEDLALFYHTRRGRSGENRAGKLPGLHGLGPSGRSIKGLEKMELLHKGSRLPVMPVSEQEFAIIMRLAGTRE